MRNLSGRALLLVLCLGLAMISPLGRSAKAAQQAGAPTPPTGNSPQPTAPSVVILPPRDDSASAKGAGQEPTAELASHDEPTTFKVNVRLVLVRVVARDGFGHAVGNLRKEDFDLFDNGKPQIISHFAVEQPATQVAVRAEPNLDSPGPRPPAPMAKPMIAEHYVAFVFDDVHAQFEDLSLVRSAFERRLASLQPTDRIAIFSTSGQTMLDFTDDRAKIHATLSHLQPRPIAGNGGMTECPNMTYYMGDLIQNKHDVEATQAAIADVIDCEFEGNPNATQNIAVTAQKIAEDAAMQALTTGEAESRLSIGVLKDAVRRISAMPGQRSVIVVSPGFLTPGLEQDYTDLIDRALRQQIIISSLDARGLYVVPSGSDMTKAINHRDPRVETLENEYALQSLALQGDILAVLADSTGGTFFHNNNDMDEGLRQVADTPEYYYMLGFTPQNLKMNGSFHTLRVKLKVKQKYTLQARSGYFAPTHAENASEEAKREVEDEVFSLEELHDLPVDLHTQFFKASDDDAKLTVLAHLDVKNLHYRKADGRNRNDLTVVSAVFDHNGNFVQGDQKTVQMRWQDQTLENKLGAGITLRTSFDVKPGNYLVRLVVRDAEGQQMAAENGAVDIP